VKRQLAETFLKNCPLENVPSFSREQLFHLKSCSSAVLPLHTMLRCTFVAFLVLLQATGIAAQGAAFVAAGCEYTCAIRNDGATSGSLVCFGQSEAGQLGYNNNNL
jgi:hypothetical protein